ncbi:MAG: AAA family ATPase [Gammaproteobacteria bacterium]|nr:AAA family ATPase [Gammaproteobacteria bacterium]
MGLGEIRSRTGVAGLDEVLGGGLLPYRLYLVDGDPGAGKTTLALQFLLEGLRADERCMYVTLSESKQELEAGAASHGWSLDGIQILELLSQADLFDDTEQLTVFTESEVELSTTTRRILTAVEQYAPHRVVLDSLSDLRLLAQNSLRYRRQVVALKQFFMGRRCTVMMLDDRTMQGPDQQLHSIAHGVVALNSSTPVYGQIRRDVRVVKFRGSDFVSGRHDFVIRSGGLTVFPRLIAAEHAALRERGRLASGVARLDALLGGGVDRGTSTLLMGPPGSGKSTIALQFAAAAVARGEHAAVFAFDETNAAMRARSMSMGLHIAEGRGAGELDFHQIDPVVISPGEFADLIRRSVEQDDARIVIIDSLNGYLNSMHHSNYLTAQLHELLTYLNNQGVATFIVVAQSGMVGMNMAAPVEASYLADSVLMLRYFEHAGSVKKAISVLKKRTGGHEDSIRQMWFDEHGIHLSEPLLGLRGVLTGVPSEPARTEDPLSLHSHG